LEQSLARLAAQVRDISRNNSATPKGKPRRKLKLLPARLKALRLQGRLFLLINPSAYEKTSSEPDQGLEPWMSSALGAETFSE
jgi:hypothetical protein